MLAEIRTQHLQNMRQERYRYITSFSLALLEIYNTLTYVGCDCRRDLDWILDLLTPLGTTSNYSATTNLHTLNITAANTKSSTAVSR
jgi:hypothetical protein